MSNILIIDKINLIHLLNNTLDENRRLIYRHDNGELKEKLITIYNELNRYRQKYYNINSLSYEYSRFLNLHQNKYDNILSLIKIVDRLGVDDPISFNLKYDIDFKEAWRIINNNEKFVVKQYEYDRFLVRMKEINNFFESLYR